MEGDERVAQYGDPSQYPNYMNTFIHKLKQLTDELNKGEPLSKVLIKPM